MKLFKLSEKQKKALLGKNLVLGVCTTEKMDTLDNSLKYLGLNDFVNANKILKELSQKESIKNAITSNEKSGLLKKEIMLLDNDDVKRNCLLIKDKNASKNLRVPLVTIYTLEARCIEKDNKFITTYELKECKLTAFNTITLQNTLFEKTTEKDFIEDNDLLNVKQSDIIIDLNSKFNELKDGRPLIEIEQDIQNKVKMNIDNAKKYITDYLSVHF